MKNILNFSIFFFSFYLFFVPVISANIQNGEASVDEEKRSIIVADNRNLALEINDEIISADELLNSYKLFSVISNSSTDQIQYLTLEFFIHYYAPRHVLLQEARRMGVSVTPSELEREFKFYFEKTGDTKESLSQRLSKAGLTMEDAERYLKDNLLIMKLAYKELGNPKISEEEHREFYSRNYNRFNHREKISAKHILICHTKSLGCRSDLNRDEAKKLTENIQAVATPDNFSNLASRHSFDSTGQSGGSLGEISRGDAFPSFEEAAFNLSKGEISDIVETDFGFHIIYVTDKKKSRSISFEDAREIIKREIEEERAVSILSGYSQQLLDKSGIRVRETVDGNDLRPGESKKTFRPADYEEFPTFLKTGDNLCTNERGQPIVIMFSSPDCPHCVWIGGTYDSVVKEYAGMGLIQAHHYNARTGNDYLTSENETEIPPEHVAINDARNPRRYVPYFNFGCVYDRIGTGYGQENDLKAEEWEMRKVLDAILR